jgi:hypothetical protein
MAIKTQLVEGQRRIITKVVNGQRRVSCSCCEGEPSCCMYPADELGNLYGADDLPDAVTVNWTDRFTGSMSKSGSGYAGGGATLQIVNGIWRLSDSNGTRNVGRCLFAGDGNLTQGDDLVEDQFADIYTVSATLTSPQGGTDAHSRQTPRLSLCFWSYSGEQEDPDNFIFVLNVIFDPLRQRWVGRYVLDSITNFGTAFFIKDDSQNTPVGTYALEFFYDLSSENPDDGGGEIRYDYTGTFTVSEV